MTPAAVYGLCASALLLGAAASFVPWRRHQALGIAVAVAALFSIAPMLHGALAAPSFTLAQLALLRLLAPDRGSPLSRGPALGLVALAAVLYPLALGIGPWDPYDLGYRPLPLLLAAVPLGLWAVRCRRQDWLLLLGFDCLAYAAGLFDNLWNAAVDPLLAVIAAASLLRRPQRETARPIS